MPPKSPSSASATTTRATPRRTSKRPPSPTGEAARAIALLAAKAGLDKKALELDIIDVRGKVDYADFLVLMTGTSDRHVASIARGIEEDLHKAGHKALVVEGLTRGEWVLIDFFDIVVHVFSEDARHLYDLGGLWSDAERVPVSEVPKG
jgi:ribosome-associated protein